jgi:glycine cleavage system H protein
MADEYPEELRYTPEHEWVRQEGPATVRFGITSFAAEQLGDVVFVQLPGVGADITAGEPCGEVESTKSVSDIYAPVTGRVLAVNGELEEAPELVNTSPYEAGWMVEVEVAADDLPAAWDALLSAADYKSTAA